MDRNINYVLSAISEGSAITQDGYYNQNAVYITFERSLASTIETGQAVYHI